MKEEWVDLCSVSCLDVEEARIKIKDEALIKAMKFSSFLSLDMKLKAGFMICGEVSQGEPSIVHRDKKVSIQLITTADIQESSGT